MVILESTNMEKKRNYTFGWCSAKAEGFDSMGSEGMWHVRPILFRQEIKKGLAQFLDITPKGRSEMRELLYFAAANSP